MASNTAIGILKGLGTALKLDYEEQKLQRERAWQQEMMDKKIEDGIFTYRSQKVIETNLENEENLALFNADPQGYLQKFYSERAKELNLEGPAATKWVNKSINSITQEELNRFRQRFKGREINVAKRTIGAPTTIDGQAPSVPEGGFRIPVAVDNPAELGSPVTLLDSEAENPLATTTTAQWHEGTRSWVTRVGDKFVQLDNRWVQAKDFKIAEVPSGFGGSIKKAAETLGEFNKNAGRFADSITIAYDAIEKNRTSPAAVENALLTFASNTTAEFNAAKELIATSMGEEGANIAEVGSQAVEQEEYWTQKLGINSKLVASRELREAMVSMTFQKLAANSQTGQAVSVREFEATLSALGGGLSDGVALQEVLRSQIRQMEVSTKTVYSLLDKTMEDKLREKFPEQRLIDKIRQTGSHMGIKYERGSDPSGEGEIGVSGQPEAQPSITAQASEALQQLEMAYRNTPDNLKADRLKAMLEHRDVRVRTLAQRLRQEQNQ